MVEIKRLIWDDGNIAHIARHEVVPDEVEATCQSDPLVQQGKKGRLAITGQTQKGRVITVILDPEPEEGVYYVVTAYTTSGKYRRIYEREKGGEKAA